MTEKYIMMELNDERMKHLSEILSNDSCKKILNLLAEKEASETDIANELGMPLNTAEYNIKKLVSAGMIETSKHWWSVKGKKIPVYKLSNKKIIISPKTGNKLKSIVPAVLITGFVSVLLRYYLISHQYGALDSANKLTESAGSAPMLATSSAGSVASTLLSSVWLWFLAGSLFALVIFIILNWRKL